MVNPADDLTRRFRALWKEAQALDDPALLNTLRRIVAPSVDAEAVSPDADWHGFVGVSPRILEVRNSVERFAGVASPVLIRGESGTGKDLIARIIHDLSPRRDHAMVCENCAAIPENLLESVLFGHAKGAFTGAVRDHAGHFVAAHRGTIFLDEIGDMPLAMQAKILRVLQEGEVRALGKEKARKVDVRVIAATHRDLEAMVREKQFREDLFFRLNVLRVDLPPLRERGEDVVLLARRILASASEKAGRVLRLGAIVERAIRHYDWPGNVRQLQNEMQRVVALADGPEVLLDDLSPAIGSAGV